MTKIQLFCCHLIVDLGLVFRELVSMLPQQCRCLLQHSGLGRHYFALRTEASPIVVKVKSFETLLFAGTIVSLTVGAYSAPSDNFPSITNNLRYFEGLDVHRGRSAFYGRLLR